MNRVCPIVGENLSLTRKDRALLTVDHIELGTRAKTPRSSDSARFIAIVGPNGAGKSLLVHTLCALLRPDTGNVLWAGSPADKQRRHRVGLMLQKPVLLRRTAEANLVYALRLAGHKRDECLRLSREALAQAALSHVRHVTAERLSGGEQQRVALLRALLLKPEIIFLDEATANVDPASTLVIEQQLLQARAEGVDVVMITHDTAQAKRLADEVILMHAGRVVERADCSAFFQSPQQALTQRWIAGELLV